MPLTNREYAKVQKGKEIQDHSINEVFTRYKAKQETEFVKTFFGKEEANSILETCGIPEVEEFAPEVEYPVHIGYSTSAIFLLFQVAKINLHLRKVKLHKL